MKNLLTIFCLLSHFGQIWSSKCFERNQFTYHREYFIAKSIGENPKNLEFTNYQVIMRCAKIIYQETFEPGLFGPKMDKCVWLDALNHCNNLQKKNGVNCDKPILDLIKNIMKDLSSIEVPECFKTYIAIRKFYKPYPQFGFKKHSV